MRRASWLVLVLLAAFTLPAGAQKKAKEPKRPNVGADKNDPDAYYWWGVKQMQQYPDDAADAFYWAVRLDPGRADFYYARWAALHLMDPDRLVSYYRRDSKTLSSADVRQVDSLRLHAMQLNPYLFRRFERMMYDKALERRIVQRNSGVDQAALADAIREAHSEADAGTKAIDAYTNGNFPFALQEWAADLPSWKNKAYPHSERARIFYMLGSYDSAQAEFTSAMRELEATEKNTLVFVYDSKELYQQSLGMIAEKLGNQDGAREAYGRALQEDLSYAPAHMALSMMDLAKHDTAGALSEMETATQVAPNDAFIAFVYGRSLLFSAKDAPALEQLKRAAALEPYYAEPHVFMAAIYDNSDFKDEAMAEYAKFMDLAPQKDPRVAKVKGRLDKMRADSTAAAGKP
jgi:tetratricopeptide (TPR) repeat protein